MKRLVLVGGGHAHLSVLRAMAQKCPPDVEVTLVASSEQQNYSGMLPGWISGHYAQAECCVDLRPLAEAAGADLVIEKIVGMDAARHCVGLAGGLQVEYDLLSLDVGSEADTSWLQTLGNSLLPAKPLDDFYLMWPKVLADARKKAKFKLVVVGAGVAGVEIALAAKYAFDQASIDAQVDLVASESGLLAAHAKGMQNRVRRYVERAGLQIHCQRGVGSDGGVLLSDGTLLQADRVIAATGTRPPVWLQVSGLALDASGFILVDHHHRSNSHANVFAVGDVCARPDATMARSGVQVVSAGALLARNLMAVLHGAALKPVQSKPRSLYLLNCAPKYAVASWGRWSIEGQWVWQWKDWVDRRFVQRFSGTRRLQAVSVLKESQ